MRREARFLSKQGTSMVPGWRASPGRWECRLEQEKGNIRLAFASPPAPGRRLQQYSSESFICVLVFGGQGELVLAQVENQKTGGRLAALMVV